MAALFLPVAQLSVLADKPGVDEPQVTQDQKVEDEYNLDWVELFVVTEPIFDEAESRQIVRLSLQDFIARTLKHNLDLRTGSFDPAIQMAEVTRLEAAFDAVMVGSAQYETFDQGNPNSGFYTRTIMRPSGQDTIKIATDPFTQQKDYNYLIGLQKRLATGATLEIAQRMQRLHMDREGLFLNPYYESSFDLELRQPLLRDFGIDVNRASINAARNNLNISYQQYNLLAIQTVAEVENNYWTLVYFRQRVRILEQLLDWVIRTNDRLIRRMVLDAVARNIGRSEGLIAQTQAELISAKNDVKLQQDRLLESINDPSMRVGSFWEIIPTDKPTTVEYLMDREEAQRIALEKRPELIAQQLTIDTTEIALGVAENQLWPRLDMVLRQEMNAPGGKPKTAWEEQNGYNAVNYTFGFSFEIPLGNRAAQANLIQAQYERRQEKLRMENFREQVRADATISRNSLVSAFEGIAPRIISVNKHENILKAQLAMERTDAKIDANTLDIKLMNQERLTRAYDALANTIFTYNTAIISMQRAQGTLLRYNNIKLAESPDEPGVVKIKR
ncbi:MAG: TolC family protein [Planctomycetes bacterium]|nr:TolC family protein [Planctomycetota bacterium]